MRKIIYKILRLLGIGNRFLLWAPPGHFYSPVPSPREICQREKKIFCDYPEFIEGINLQKENQLRLLKEFKCYYKDVPFPENKEANRRYYFDNPAFSYSDAIFLFFMMRHFQPKRIIEIGTGFSSCAILDINELFFSNSIRCSFVDPYPDLLNSLIQKSDRQVGSLFVKPVQGVDLGVFSELDGGDMLFIDSSHVSKIDSDVNHIFFNILPILKKGVIIHFHDIFYPFEYPREWVMEGRAWNEDYMMRTFLSYNDSFNILLFNSYVGFAFENFIKSEMPLCSKNWGGSLWIEKMK